MQSVPHPPELVGSAVVLGEAGASACVGVRNVSAVGVGPKFWPSTRYYHQRRQGHSVRMLLSRAKFGIVFGASSCIGMSLTAPIGDDRSVKDLWTRQLSVRPDPHPRTCASP